MRTLVTRLIGSMLATVAIAPAAHAGTDPDFTEIVRENGDAVVNISTVRREGRQRGPLPPGVDPRELPEFFRHFFEDPPGGEDGPGGRRQRRSLGSGFIISSDGHVVTNHHVIREADEIFVRLNNRRELKAEVIGADPRSDLALLDVDAQGLPTAELGSSRDLEIGAWVLALGSPFGFDHSATAGIVSAKSRSLPTRPNETYVPFVQTDVAINPGSSGGPLFDRTGKIVGVNAQIFTRSGGYMGLAFAVPAETAKFVIEQLEADGEVTRGRLGALVQEVHRELAASFGLPKPAGALVARVEKDGPAAKAGLQEGDVILAYNGKSIERSGDLPPLVGRTRPGETATLQIMRDGEQRRVEVTIGKLPPPEGEGVAAAADGDGGAANERLGIAVRPLEGEAARALEHGVRVSEVGQGPAAAAGIRPADIILQLGGEPVTSPAALNRIVKEVPAGRSIAVQIVRDGTPAFLALRIPRSR